ncbi:hypothetical protein POTOM_046979 [Populus tomentosa]|uniref:Glutaredoxin domain-containing protein n=1 Tax=Populus tomentosa TaxID=118781 RepID=A0A8X8CEE2_POPTO|nr:hypothetical protein POTOM_046979 [Populus tomentosa]
MDVLNVLIQEKPVVIFSKSSCCMSHSVETLIRGFGANPTVYNLDRIPNGQQIERALMQLGFRQSVPAVFIGQQLVGNERNVMSLHLQNQLMYERQMRAKNSWSRLMILIFLIEHNAPRSDIPAILICLLLNKAENGRQLQPGYPFDLDLVEDQTQFSSYKLSPIKHPFFSQVLPQLSYSSMELAMPAAFNLNSFLVVEPNPSVLDLFWFH